MKEILLAARHSRWLKFVALPLVLVLAYQLWASSAESPFFPTVGVIFRAFFDTWGGDGFVENVVPSLTNLAVGYISGVVLGLAIGVLLSKTNIIRIAVTPIISFLLALPAVALVPLFITVAGIGPAMSQSIIAFAVTLYVLVNTVDGLVNVDSGLVDVNHVFRIRGWRQIFLVLLPSIAPRLLGAGRAALSLSILIMVVSEMVGASSGIGAVTLLSQQSFQYSTMWAGMVMVAVLGIGLNALYLMFERPMLRRSGISPLARTMK